MAILAYGLFLACIPTRKVGLKIINAFVENLKPNEK